MNKTFYFTIVSFLVCTSKHVFSQDAHFSNVEYAPLSLNPALAGVHSPLQAIVNYRSQWNSVGEAFKTLGASFDAQLNTNNSRRNGILAAGLNFVNDKTGPQLTTNSVNLNFVYHILMNRNSAFGVGLYGGLHQKSLSQANGRWGAQYNGTSYDGSLSNGENFSNSSSSAFDAGTGLVYSFNNDRNNRNSFYKKEFTMGLAAYHLNRPNDSFLSNGAKLPMRFTFFANANIELDNSSILPGLYIQQQGQANQILVGTNYKILLNKGSNVTGYKKASSVSFGLFGRLKDALVFRAMYEIEQFSVGLSYDINVSSLRKASNAKGGFEFLLRYNLRDLSLWRNKM